jgi:hypothetical protein
MYWQLYGTHLLFGQSPLAQWQRVTTSTLKIDLRQVPFELCIPSIHRIAVLIKHNRHNLRPPAQGEVPAPLLKSRQHHTAAAIAATAATAAAVDHAADAASDAVSC